MRDEHGIAVGGVRLPQAEVPVAQNSAIPLGQDIYSMLWGSSHPFDAATLDSLYADEEAYIAEFTKAAHAAVGRGGPARAATSIRRSPRPAPSTAAPARAPPADRRPVNLSRWCLAPTRQADRQSLVKRCSRNGSPYMW